MENDDQNNQQNKPSFQPAKNPFLNAIGMSSQKQQQVAEEPKNKDVVVGNKDTTLVGSTAEQKSAATSLPEPEQKIPEETLYEWQAPEFAYTQKPVGWYLAIFAFFVGLAVVAFFFINSDIFDPIQNVFSFTNVTLVHDGQLLQFHLFNHQFGL